MWVYVCVHVHVCAHISVKTRGRPQRSFLRNHLVFQDWLSHCSKTCQFGEVAREPQGLSVSFASSSSVITSVYHHARLYVGSGG